LQNPMCNWDSDHFFKFSIGNALATKYIYIYIYIRGW
jgi:hypothetical protein